jgi:hypothetical protein
MKPFVHHFLSRIRSKRAHPTFFIGHLIKRPNLCLILLFWALMLCFELVPCQLLVGIIISLFVKWLLLLLLLLLPLILLIILVVEERISTFGVVIILLVATIIVLLLLLTTIVVRLISIIIVVRWITRVGLSILPTRVTSHLQSSLSYDPGELLSWSQWNSHSLEILPIYVLNVLIVHMIIDELLEYLIPKFGFITKPSYVSKLHSILLVLIRFVHKLLSTQIYLSWLTLRHLLYYLFILSLWTLNLWRWRTSIAWRWLLLSHLRLHLLEFILINPGWISHKPCDITSFHRIKLSDIIHLCKSLVLIHLIDNFFMLIFT